METKDNQALNELRRLTECCICLMPFTDPRMLPCIHSACLKCYEDIQTTNQKKPGDVISCPVCRKEFTIPSAGMSGLQKNFFIANLLEIMQNLNEERPSQLCQMCKIIDAQKDANVVTMVCLECREIFCERCANVHKFNNLTQGHRIVEVKGNLSEEGIPMAFPSPNCPNHPHKLLDLYCGDCKAVVCVSCFVEKHTLHDCKDVTTVDKDFRKSLEISSAKMLHYIAQMESEKSKVESKRTKIWEQSSEIENTVRLKNQQLKALIDEHTQLVLNELSSMKQRHLKNIEIEVEEIERKMTILKSFETYCSEIKSKGSPTDVCSCVDGLMRRADELKKENDEYLSRPDSAFEIKFNATDQDVPIRNSSNFIGQIQGDLCDLILIGFPSIQDANKVAEKTDEQKKVEQQQQQQLSNYRAKTLQKLRTFSAYDGLEVTNCAFVKRKVEIFYILKDTRPIDKEMLKESLTSHLEIQAGDLKLTELRSRPVYKETSIQPGDICLSGQPQSQSSIGAFVEVPGKGIHALMSGHGKTSGATFCHPNGNELGRVEVSLTPLPNISTNEDAVFRDIALGRLNNQIPFNSTVTTGDGSVLRLKEDPGDAEIIFEEMLSEFRPGEDEMPVRLFTNGDRKGEIKSAFYVVMDNRLNIQHRFLSVQNSADQAVHDEGESGILVVPEPPGDHANGAVAICRVTAVGMLVGIETREHVDPDRTETVSLAAPLESGFDALRRNPYCNGEIQFC